MFCRKCGSRFDDSAKFCPECGEKVIHISADSINRAQENQQNYGGAYISNNSQGQAQYNNYNNAYNWNENFQNEYNSGSGNSFKDPGKGMKNNYFTDSNIERFAPLAAFTPIAMAGVIRVVGLIMRMASIGLYRLPFWSFIETLVFSIIKLIFLAVAIGATTGLINIVVKEKDTSNIYSWIAPIATLLASIACLMRVTAGFRFSWIFAIPAMVLGFELLARVVISNKAMDTPVDFGGALETYKQFIDASKKQRDDNESNAVNSEFDGSGIELLGYIIVTVIVSIITLGIGAPWMICAILKWVTRHTVINGKRLIFTGSGASLLGYWILWEFLTVITLGIFSLFSYVALKKWMLKRTYIEGETIVVNGNESYFDGNTFAYLGHVVLYVIICVFTLGLGFPWADAMLKKWETKHKIINKRRLSFNGSGLGFLIEYLIIALLTIVTLGIYLPWGIVRYCRYITKNTEFVG